MYIHIYKYLFKLSDLNQRLFMTNSNRFQKQSFFLLKLLHFLYRVILNNLHYYESVFVQLKRIKNYRP